ncbi:hypothetical protein GTE7_gp089 [Gordonia phage GTE7]|uniref:Uncharacterized protein n=1 Tax=Gordonia phage GTE7 TaxID=1100814 RepID=G8FS82_9CAUD|nr:hypothetical protein GTE7_gp089 [Gordonia phage GTE7]AER26632.1 hypothetical protein [Gordonia phage GTE7]
MTITLDKHVPMCSVDFEKKYGDEPDMDSDAPWTWNKGKCAQCGTPGIVFTFTND